MGAFTSFFNLFKPSKSDKVKVSDLNPNWDTIDTEMHKPPLTVNGTEPDENRNIYIDEVPLAANLSSDIAQFVSGGFIERTSGGDAPIGNGTATLVTVQGNAIHTGYVAESINMTVNAATRTAPPAITAELDEATFEAYVETAGIYTITYSNGWSADPADYGLTITNTPVDGDSITMNWDGENDATVTVNAVPRVAPPAITATLNRDTFVAYVDSSQTITLTYTSGWSANPALYGITVANTPISGDEIVVVYVKEDRGTISVATPSSFNSTGWNLYNNSTGYAMVVKYSEVYGYMLGGSYSLAEFSTTLTGTRTTLTISSGNFTVPSDGYVFITGGDATTYIYPTWSDWTDGYSGDFQTYTVDTIDLSEIMLYFPNGLLAVGGVRDEINLNTNVIVNRIQRLAYTSENIAAVIASGVAYDADTNYIYAVLQTPTTRSISVDGAYTVSDHGIEFFAGTSVPVFAECIYGENLKDKLRTDVLTISAQTLSTAQKDQVATNLGIDRSVLRDVPFAVGVSDWTLVNGVYTANFASDYVTSASKVIMTYDKSLEYAQAHIEAAIKSGGGGMTFTTSVIPTGTVKGNLYVFANNDGKLPVLVENTVTSIANGGTGQSSLSGAQDVLGITALSNNITNLIKKVVWKYVHTAFTQGSYGYFTIPVPSAYQNKYPIAVMISHGHPGRALQFSGNGYGRGETQIWCTYYAPNSVSASENDFYVTMAYSDSPITTTDVGTVTTT